MLSVECSRGIQHTGDGKLLLFHPSKMFQINQSIDDIVSIDTLEHKRDCLKILVALMILYEEDDMLAIFMTVRIRKAKGLYD